MSDDLQRDKSKGFKINQIIYNENTKKVIQLQDVLDAFRVVYEDVGYLHQGVKGVQHNKLRTLLIQVDKQREIEEMKKIAHGLKTGKAKGRVDGGIQVPEGFVVEDDKEVLRLGNKK